MKLLSAVISISLLCGAVSAAPFTHLRRTSFEQRRLPRGGSSMLHHSRTGGSPLAADSTSFHDRIQVGPQREIQYSSNWAGAVQIGSNITTVSGIANFPNVALPRQASNVTSSNSTTTTSSSSNSTTTSNSTTSSNSSSSSSSSSSTGTQHGGSAWIGIDGDTCQTAILQTGMDWVIDGGNTTEYSVWYEWLPEYSYDFDLVVRPGHSVAMKVVAHNTTSGTAYVHNLSTGQKAHHTFVGEHALCLENAEWIVEDFEVAGSNGQPQLIPFAAFDEPVTFRNAAYTKAGASAGVKGATMLDMQQNGKLVTHCKTNGEDELQCNYVG